MNDDEDTNDVNNVEDATDPLSQVIFNLHYVQ